ncbi:contact-dependent growth inhibition system immunity protein [Marinobacter confluentis]|uniref:CdiI immunity protein domain-containing protein n=1 Tax=Marinobacter confluentis TaxID=1697557 RepID=A0A4Z1CFJ2_9GAMM|nr:contact-dependent growth inhibition system immunity protein [Marinobacter confluentis]TGN38854.1 hypothetical protein E5Q11_14070 [Marinobacter confluentis]
MNKDLFNNLEQILGAYFHQDWEEEFSSEKSVIEYILENEPPQKIISAKEAIDELLNIDMSESEYKEKIFSMGSEYEYEVDGYTSKQWLKYLRDSFDI